MIKKHFFLTFTSLLFLLPGVDNAMDRQYRSKTPPPIIKTSSSLTAIKKRKRPATPLNTALPEPKMIILDGSSSTGKTTLSNALYKKLNSESCPWITLSRDSFISDFFVTNVLKLYEEYYPEEPQPIRGETKEEIFEIQVNPEYQDFSEFCSRHQEEVHPIFEGIVIGNLLRTVEALYEAGISLIIDHAPLTSYKERKRWFEVLQKHNPIFLKVTCPYTIAEERERERGNRRPGLVKKHWPLVGKYENYETVYDITVDTEQPINEIVTEILRYMDDLNLRDSNPFEQNYTLIKQYQDL